jgi:outer membrane protein assembly factor BamB
MLKKIILALIILPVIATGIYFYLVYRQQKTPISDALNAVPSNASFILETRQAQSAWKKISETNLIWENLLATEFFTGLNKNLKFIDSLFANVPGAYPMLDNRSVFVSAHLAGAKSFDFLYTFSLPDLSKQTLVKTLVIGASGNTTEMPERNYDDGVISAVKFLQSNRVFYYTVHKGIFSGSFSQVLVEDAIRQLNSGISIINDKNFARVANTAGEKVDANIYINYKSFPDILATFLKASSKKSMQFLSGFANWSELDVSIKPNALLMNGFTYSSDSAHHYLNLFAKQKSQQIEVTKIIPANTSTLLFLGLSNFKTFYRDYQTWLDSKGAQFDQKKTITELNIKYSVDMERSLLGCIDNEIALCITEPNKKDFSANSFAIFRSNKIIEAATRINNFADSVSAVDGDKVDTSNFRGFTIKKFPLSKIWQLLLGDMFADVNANCFAVIEDYIVFGNSVNALQGFIADYGSGRTLIKNSYYNEFTKNNLADEANLYLYSNIARSTSIYKNYVADAYEPDIEKYLAMFQKFEAVGIQLSADNDMFYQNIFIKHNPIYKQETNSLFETALDTTVSSTPVFVANHNNKIKEIFVQDDANTVYLISNTGKILWQRTLDGKIMSTVHQVDAKKNNKLQLLVNTPSSIYLIDRNGKDVDGFPIKLKAKATNTIAVFDYDNSREYRIMITCEDKKVYNYTIEGKEAAKWNFAETEQVVKAPIKHFSIAGKDYLLVADVSGNIYITNRRGEKVLKPKEHLLSANNLYFINAGKELSQTVIVTTDSLGNVLKLQLNGDLQNSKLKDFSGKPFFTYTDIDADGVSDYILSTKHELTIFKADKSAKSIHLFDKGISGAHLVLNYPDKKRSIAVVNSTASEIYLLDDGGNLHKSMPLFGSTLFDLADMNKDGHINVVTCNGKSVYVYSLE